MLAQYIATAGPAEAHKIWSGTRFQKLVGPIERFHIHSNENEHKNNHGYIVKSAILLNQFQCASALKLWWKVQKRGKTLISSNFSIVNMENADYTKKEITYMMRTFTFKETSETPIQRSIGWFNNMA